MNHAPCFDIAIIGNGILGYSTAYALQQKNPYLKIAIIGPRGREGGATVAAGAMLNCFAETTTQTLQTFPNRTKFEMCYRSLKMWPHWIEEINAHLPPDDRLSITPGTWVILNSRSSQLDTDNFLSILKTLDQYKEPFEEVNPRDLDEINPLQGSRPLRALWIPGEGSISSLRVLSSLEMILRSVAFINDEAIQILIESNAVTGIQLAKGAILRAEKVLLAAGASSQKLLDKIPEIQYTMPLICSGVGYSIQAQQNPHRPIRHVIRTPNRAGACGLHVLPRDSETLYIGASNDLSFYPHKSPKLGMLNFLMECAFQQIDQQLTSSRWIGYHVGNRPASIDSFPLIGELSIQNLFVMTGTYRDGFHQSPLLAAHMASVLCGEKGCVSEIFKPQRPLIQVRDVAASIDEYLAHFQGSSYEHSVLLPTGILTDQEYLELIRHRTETLYGRLETSYGLPPDVLFMFDLDSESRQKLGWFKEYLQKMKFQSVETENVKTW